MQKHYKFISGLLALILGTGLEAMTPAQTTRAAARDLREATSGCAVVPQDLLIRLLTSEACASPGDRDRFKEAQVNATRRAVQALCKTLEGVPAQAPKNRLCVGTVATGKATEGLAVGSTVPEGVGFANPNLCERIGKFKHWPKIEMSEVALNATRFDRPNMSIGPNHQKQLNYEGKCIGYKIPHTNYCIGYKFTQGQWMLIEPFFKGIPKANTLLEIEAEINGKSIEYNNDEDPVVTKGISLLDNNVYLNIESPDGSYISIPMPNLQATDIDSVNHTCKLLFLAPIAEQDGQ